MAKPSATGSPPPIGAARRRGAMALWAVLSLLAIALAGAGIDWYRAAPPEALTRATYVGRQSCVACHQQEHADWTGSHHDLAMDLATDESVLADFNNVTFEHQGVTTRLFRDGGRFMVNTEGPDGAYADFEVKYTFGVDPLQQYMVELPASGNRGAGRVQVLRVSWDTHRREWFYLEPPDVADERILPGDPLHWTGITQNWNTTCAICHSTNLQKNYDLATDSYHTTFSEIDVSCEECHGPASLHVELASARSLFWDRRHGYGLAKLKSPDPTAQIEACAKCHARRNVVHDHFRPGTPLLDSYEPALLDEGLYHADGQILDEVYVYGSFVQSKMHAKGVRCTDCHNPHSLALERPGNQMCAKCHEPAKYDVVAHHHHQPGTAGAQCVECHMPATTYMAVDPRRDHSFRVPRPDLTVSAGTPNACGRCHTKPEESAAWAAAKVVEWYGPERKDGIGGDGYHWAPALAAGRATKPEGEQLLIKLAGRETAPAIARATALSLLGRYDSDDARRAINEAIDSREPMLRLAALRSTPPRPASLDDLAARLFDPTLAVRMEASRRLVGVPAEELSAEQRDAQAEGLRAFRRRQGYNADHAGSHMNLSNLAAELRDPEGAIEALRTAIRVEPYLSGPRGRLASLLETHDASASASEVERLRREEIALLTRDAGYVPENANIRYRLGLLAFTVGDLAASEAALAEACGLAPGSYDYRLALALLQERRFNETGDDEHFRSAVASLNRLNAIRPKDPGVIGVMRRLIATKKAAER
ncbi:MAG: cytochrome c3 family protein [Planctomycetota bacterium]